MFNDEKLNCLVPILHKVTFAEPTNYEKNVEINLWLRDNCTGNYYSGIIIVDGRASFEFDEEHDATLFGLKWS